MEHTGQDGTMRTRAGGGAGFPVVCELEFVVELEFAK